MTKASVQSIHIGPVATLGAQREPSAFVKHAVEGPIEIGWLGLAGDFQADLSVHGGPDKAVYGYGAAHYTAWRAEYPNHAARFVPGGVGENLAIAGLTEIDICVGDVHAIGTARLQVCQPRQPCFKFALRFDDNRVPKAMVRSGRAGWYYRVLQPGTIKSGDAIDLYERPNPDFSFARLVELVNHGDATLAELQRLSRMPGLAANWQCRVREALDQAG
jgi:MOSC domain-containing protein YiiM